jgi:hypothetical protein
MKKGEQSPLEPMGAKDLDLERIRQEDTASLQLQEEGGLSNEDEDKVDEMACEVNLVCHWQSELAEHESIKSCADDRTHNFVYWVKEDYVNAI